MLARIRRFLFENQGARQTVAKNAFWILAGQLGGRAARAVFVIVAARALGADMFGIFSYALGAGGFFTIFGDLGLSVIVTKETAHTTDTRRLATVYVMKLGLAVIAGALAVLLLPRITGLPGIYELAPIIGLLVLFDVTRDFCAAIFRGQERMEREAVTFVVANLVIVGLGFAALALWPGSITAIALAYALGSALSNILPFAMLRREFSRIWSLFSAKLMRPLLAAALPVTLTSIFGSLMLNTDLIVLGWLQSPANLGYYSAGQKIVQLLYILPATLAGSIFPLLVRLAKGNDRERSSRAAETGMAILLLAAFPIAIGGIILAAPLLTFLYGSEYLPATVSFQILAGSVLFVFPGALIANIILAYDQQRKLAWYTGITAVGNAVLDVALIPVFGIAGCAIATFLMQGVYGFLSLRLARRSLPFRVFAPAKRIAAASVLMGVCAALLTWWGVPVLATIAASVVAYAAFLYLFREPAFNELLALRRSI